ncbi:hypothetical protein Pint_23534 [Pistacia integerrima]|uniref:Uncharacterized protein n=1 Tax=Pistacia integerrima TaxID=434235 RepID=A0ACC0YLX7_9ROSI|nr:hypothetical protein Pint_23534 [Pistacia integerrima]
MLRLAFSLYLIFTLALLLNLAHSKTLKRDVKALNEIKASLGWRVVYSWVGDDPCGDSDLPPWSGVTCSTQGDYRVVTELQVYAVSIVGLFPTAVTNLLDLTRLNLRWNKFQDVIPSEIGELKGLTHLYLSFNNFKGEIPKELANLPELRYLYLHENRLSGRIPPELGTLQNLRHLDVGNNHLVGTIRELIRIEGSFPALRNLYLNNNYLTGGIPAQLANLTKLEILYLSYNKMSGIIPSELAHIPRLTYLYLDHNQFSGRIPIAFYKHRFLKEMYIERNSFRPGVNPIGFHKVLEIKAVSFLLLLTLFSLCLAEDVKVAVQGVTSIGTTDDNFVCATLDWWPVNKCDYDQCPWGKAGILNLDLKNKILSNAIKAFNSLRIRVGGSLQDQVLYKVGNSIKKCPHFKLRKDGLFGFSHGCLFMDRWDELNQLFKQTGAVVTFALNALIGRHKSKTDTVLWEGDWHSENARDLMKYTITKGYNIESYELGNELCGSGVGARVAAEQYAKDIVVLKNLVKELYPNATTQPKVLGPAGFYDKKWFQIFLEQSGQDVVDGLTHHIYNLGAGNDPALITRIQDPFYLNQIAQTYKDMEMTVKEFGPWSGAWVGEAGGAYNSGGKTVSHTFVNGFWYLDQLGMTSTFNHKPGISMLLINMSNKTSFDVSVINDENLYGEFVAKEDGGKMREEYHLTPKDGNIQSDEILLNGTPLKLTNSSDIPPMNPKLVNPSSPISVAADSIVFVTLRDFDAPACA